MTAEADGFVIVKVPRSRLNLAWMSIVPSGPSPAAPPSEEAKAVQLAADHWLSHFSLSIPPESFVGHMQLDDFIRAARTLAVDRGASAPPAPDWKAAALACVIPMEALHADNLAGSQLIAPSLRVAIAEAVVALRNAVAGGASAPVPTGESGAAESGVSEAG